MIYADTDFFLALLKDKDWLRDRALRLYNEHKHELTTSVVAVVELLLLSSRVYLDPERLLISAFELVPRIVGIDKNTALVAAHYMKEKNFRVFDALHAAFCAEQTIISSDHAYDKIGLQRIKLEP